MDAVAGVTSAVQQGAKQSQEVAYRQPSQSDPIADAFKSALERVHEELQRTTAPASATVPGGQGERAGQPISPWVKMPENAAANGSPLGADMLVRTFDNALCVTLVSQVINSFSQSTSTLIRQQ